MTDPRDLRVETTLDVRSADHDITAFAQHIADLIEDEPTIVDLSQHHDSGNQISLRTTRSRSQTPPPDSVIRDGVATIPDFVGPEQLADLRREVEQLLAGEHALHFPKSTRVWDLYRHGQAFVDLLTHPDLVATLTAVLGEHYLLSDYSLNVVNPAQPVDDWHIDYPYNEMRHLVQGSTLGVQCVLALDHFTTDNGATQYIPGSHHPPRKPDARSTTQPHTAEVKPGTLLIMAASTWHRSGYNSTDRARAGILLSFVEHWIRPMSNAPEPGPWSTTEFLRTLLGQQRPPETINGVPIDGSTLG